jgi:hypothetical protein
MVPASAIASAGDFVMCTLITALNPSPGVAYLVGANRDERLDRPASGPAIRLHEGGAVLCPTDLEAGGTWWGLSSTGVFAAVTNRVATPAPGRRTRGELVVQALSGGSFEGAIERAATIRPGDYNPFHLLIVGTQRGRGVGGITWSDGAALRTCALEDGGHVLTERSFQAAVDRRSPRILGALSTMGATAPAAAWLAEVGRCLRLRGEGVDDAVDVRLDSVGYGTRSSALVVASAQGDVSLAHADGPPGTTYEDLSSVARQVVLANGGEAPPPSHRWMGEGLAILDGQHAVPPTSKPIGPRGPT